jgi:DNA-directed RNA polymerase subunit K/omega
MIDNYDNSPETGKMFSRRAVTKFQEQGSEGGQYDLILLAAHRAKKMNKQGKPEYKIDPKYYEGSKNHVAVVQEVVQSATTFEELKDEYIKDHRENTSEEKEQEQELIR